MIYLHDMVQLLYYYQNMALHHMMAEDRYNVLYVSDLHHYMFLNMHPIQTNLSKNHFLLKRKIFLVNQTLLTRFIFQMLTIVYYKYFVKLFAVWSIYDIFLFSWNEEILKTKKSFFSTCSLNCLTHRNH
jgi:hypothetical protein